MNAEVISSRYAKALLAFVTEAGTGDKVYSQVCGILDRVKEVPQLRDIVLRHNDVAIDRKVSLLEAALGEPVTGELEKFIRLVKSRSRMELLEMILWAFVHRYREVNKIKYGSLVTSRNDDGLRNSLEEMFSERIEGEVHLQTDVEPELIGGFVLELDGYRLDASVRTKIEKISRELIDNSNRII